MRLFADLVPWYLAVQLSALAALPLALRFFQVLPDRGYAFAKILGIFLVGVVLWLGASYGFLRNEFGGAWLALGIVAILSYAFGGYRNMKTVARDLGRSQKWYLVGVEALFITTFLIWAWVRAHDPAANHTEQPMDLMFMNSLWVSPTLPADDAWLAGYPISYYYFGYWLLTTLGHLSSTPPALAFNIGQASWYALLLVTAFGLGFNLFGLSLHAARDDDAPNEPIGAWTKAGPPIAGVLTAFYVGVIGNLQVIFEWLYALGANIERIANWLDVNGFPANAQQSGNWYIGYDWWWWRSSRVLSDQDLMGNHIEVIDEFPMFSYILGDNHPHVLAMPVVILVIGMALSLFVGARSTVEPAGSNRRLSRAWNRMVSAVPLGYPGLLLIVAVSGGLVFLNTWDYPPYWLMLSMSMFIGLALGRSRKSKRDLVDPALSAAILGFVMALGTLVIYLPYFMTAQSQAGGVLLNLFNPSRLQQTLLMFGVFVPAIAGLLFWFWRVIRPSVAVLLLTASIVIGIPAVLLVVSAALMNTAALSGRMPLPPDAAGYAGFVLERWSTRPYTFLLFGLGLACCVSLLWTGLTRGSSDLRSSVRQFTILTVAIGLLLVYLPEFVYLRDNFGTRMNTVFKFYYQAWLLLAVGAAFMVTSALYRRRFAVPVFSFALAAATLALAGATLLFPVAGVYSKTNGFDVETRTLDAIQYVASENPDELAAISWILSNTDPDDIVLEGKGASYRANYSRMSSSTGRATLLGWDGHEAQWRGESFGEMAAGRAELLENVYRIARADELPVLLEAWGIDYVVVGPTERMQYEMSPRSESRLAEAMSLVYDSATVRIYQRR